MMDKETKKKTGIYLAVANAELSKPEGERNGELIRRTAELVAGADADFSPPGDKKRQLEEKVREEYAKRTENESPTSVPPRKRIVFAGAIAAAAVAVALFSVVLALNRNGASVPPTSLPTEKVKVYEADSIRLPDLSETLRVSDTIVKGTVTEILPEEYYNPDRTLKNADGYLLPSGIKYRATLRVDGVFFGNVKTGDEITVFTFFYTGLSKEEMEKNEVVINGRTPYKLKEGQTGIFCLCFDESLSQSDGPQEYVTVHERRGVFDRVDEDGKYHSSVYTVDPAELPALKKQADERTDN